MSSVEGRTPAVQFFVPPEEARLFDVAVQAKADQMHVLHKGLQIIVCSVIPAGWRKVAVKERPEKVPFDVHSSAYLADSEGISTLSDNNSPRKMITP